jgi:hypothetical protein
MIRFDMFYDTVISTAKVRNEQRVEEYRNAFPSIKKGRMVGKPFILIQVPDRDEIQPVFPGELARKKDC